MLFESMIPTMQIDVEKVINENEAERSEELSIMATTDTPSGEDAMDYSSIPA